MKLDIFDGQLKDELSMIEVAHAILEQKEEAISFADLVNMIQEFLEKDDSDVRDQLPQFYTDLNNDGSFISLGDNVWALRKWYAVDSIDEEVNHPEDMGDEPTINTGAKVNAFLNDDAEDDDVVDYDDDDADDDDTVIGAGEGPDLSKFTNSDLTLDDDDDEDKSDDLPDGIEGQLTEFDDADDEDIDLDEEDDDEDDDEE
ncbi:DNA-directed RNA polymerase subunit delta [Companilactobacillus sp. DQM5]|uniref:DNA-directed RNA polymerase subunit delta n=1 Tax=Companilactobacillus sp. DQM5 TaxID=3463359 RepID=UPI0040598AC6